MAKIRKVPRKYTSGLSKSTAAKRKAQIRKRATGKVTGKAKYKPLAGDSKAKTKPSKYTTKLSGLRKEISKTSAKLKSSSPRTKFITATAKETGVSREIIKKVYEKGEAAWATGHRAGASQSAWAKARVYSFLSKGKTATTADADLYIKAKKTQRKGKFKLK